MLSPPNLETSMPSPKERYPVCLRWRKERIVSRAYHKDVSALLSKDWTVEQVLESYPQTADIFVRLKADCVGCRLEWFCTLEDVVREYGLNLGEFLADLGEAVSDMTPKDRERRSI